jgi:hypothetical protein
MDCIPGQGKSSVIVVRLGHMRGRRRAMKLHVVGIDLGKTVFHLVGLDSTGKVFQRREGTNTFNKYI